MKLLRTWTAFLMSIVMVCGLMIGVGAPRVKAAVGDTGYQLQVTAIDLCGGYVSDTYQVTEYDTDVLCIPIGDKAHYYIFDKITWNTTNSLNSGNWKWSLPTWSIADTSVATIGYTSAIGEYANGPTGIQIVPQKVGETTITWTANDGSGKTASIRIRVCSDVATKLVTNETEAVTIKGIGKTYQLKPTVTYTSGKTDSQVTYASANEAVAKVSSSGVVTAVGEGTTKIEITAIYGNEAKSSTGKQFLRAVTVKVEKADTTDTKDDGKDTTDTKDDGKDTSDTKDEGKDNADTKDTDDGKTDTKTDKPKKGSLKKLTSPKKAQLKLTWKKDTKVSGYELLLATNNKFTKNKKKVTVKSYKTTSVIVKKLKSKKTYYVKIRSYKKVNGKKIYGAYSKVMKLKVK